MNTQKTETEKIEHIYNALGFSNAIHDKELGWIFYNIYGQSDVDLIRRGQIKGKEIGVLNELAKWLAELESPKNG